MKKYYELLSKRLLRINLVYMIIFTVIAYSATLIYVKSDFKNSEQKKAEQLVVSLETAISQSNTVANNMCMDDAVIRYAQADGTANIETIVAVDEKMEAYNIFPHIDVQAIINRPNEHVILSGPYSGTSSLSHFIKDYRLDETDFLKNISGLSAVNKNNTIFMNSSAEETTYMICLLSRETNYESPVIFAFLYDLNNFFSTVSESSIPTAFLIETEQNNLKFLYNRAEDGLISLSEIPDTVSYKKITNSEDYSAHFGEIRCSVFAPRIRYLLHINNFFLLLLLFVAALILIGYIFIKTNANFLYNPVKNVLALLPNNLVDNDGEFNAFEKYITSLSSQRDVMAEIISDNKIELSDKFIFKVLTSTLSGIEIKNGISAYGFENVKFPVVSFIVTYRNYNSLKEILSSEGLNEVRVSVHEYFYDIFKNYGFFNLVDIDQQTIAGIVATDNIENFTKQIKTAALGIEMLMDIDLVIFVGKPAESWYEISDSYFSAVTIKNKCWIVPSRNIVISANKSDNEKYSQIIYYSPSIEEEFINDVIAGNKELAVNQINKIIDANMSGDPLTRDHYSQLVIMMHSTFTKLLTVINKTEKELFDSVSIYLEFMSCKDAQSLKAKTADFITNIISNITITQETDAENERELILSYIHNNYANDITLFTLAEYLNISQIYASKKFKQCVGESFKDYLTNYRLDIAMEMMKNNPNENLGNIAASVGFSARTFTRAFTQKYGITPSNYIQKLK